ncbi:10541_t:CDS:2 [Dentiscutata erythropus]|uniref:10541_t:CDS:1 n=1 Tax=Dentiscutata erythropus TaxID=1348616 RepID=A0A9N9CIL4_9GLOM|nr:10541_t:CDS:2 [Dentiscutata erythropus]
MPSTDLLFDEGGRGQRNIAAQTNQSLENFTPDEQFKHLTKGGDPFPREQLMNEETPQLSAIIFSGIPFN